jgi:hypothetical protein
LDSRSSDRRADVCAVLLLLAAVLAYAARFLNFGERPEEDAAMLLRYSEHLARGYGIVWNVGEPPVDGATDFLFMVLVAVLRAAGLPLEDAARGLGMAAHLATVLLVYFGARRLHDGAPPLALVGAAFLAFGPGLRHLTAGYGTPLFALLGTISWWAATRATQAGDAALPRAALILALASLTLGLARPEGVFLGVFFLVAVLVYRRGRGATVLLGRFGLVFLTLGLAYFAWRWHYFGYPLPNPFYKKGGGVLHFHSLRMAGRNLWPLTLPFLALLVAGLGPRSTRRQAVFTLLPVLSFTTLWALISDETNYVMRFRYPIVPVVLIGSVGVVVPLLAAFQAKFTAPGAGSKPALAWASCLAAAAGLAVLQHGRYHHIVPARMGLHEAALALREWRPRAYALATTEAGLLPLYSGWRAVDAWGLNDAFIAHHGGITDEYLDRYRPEVIVFHAYFSPGRPESGPRVEGRSLGPAWYRMVMTLKGYAERNRYVLAACYGRHAWDTHYYYVRSGFPDSRAIVDRLRSLEYFWDGEPTTNFAPAP